MRYIKNIYFIYLLIILIFLARLLLINYPPFTPDEARIAYRGHTLATTGQDELGRSFPVLFNSLTDYQLPVTSYIAALGNLLFGKNNFGARLPFIAIFLLITLLIYKISDIFSPKKEFRLFCVLIAIFSPALFFSSQTPNETIVLTFEVLYLFYLLTRKKINYVKLFILQLITLGTSKESWMILFPFVIFTLTFFQTGLSRKIKLSIVATMILSMVIIIFLFLQVPQSQRSLMENNFLLFQDSSLRAVENKLRGQGLESGWPNLLEKILFNKFQFLIIGLLGWLSYLNPAILFSQLDKEGIRGFFSMGAFSKILIVPFIAGLIYIIQQNDKKFKALFFIFLTLTFPSFFIYPNNNYQNIIIGVIPFVIIVVALGLNILRTSFKCLILILMVFELFLNLTYLKPEVKNAGSDRPVWIQDMVKDVYKSSLSSKVAISDDFVLDVVPFIEWYSPVPAGNNFNNAQFPYKFHQMQLSEIKIIGSDDTFYFCSNDKPTTVFISKRDLSKINKFLNIDESKMVEKVYIDDLGKETAYLLQQKICVH